MSMLRAATKAIAEAAFASRVARRMGASRISGRSLILAYHGMQPSGVAARGEKALHLDFDTFRRQIDEVCRRFPVVPLEDVIEPEGPPCVAITFDDAYEGAVALAFPELRARQLPSTVFVAPGILGTTPWWDAVADRVGLEDRLRRYCLEDLAGDAEQISATLPDLVPVAGQLGGARIVSIDDLMDSANELLTIGAHSWAHPNLTRVDDARLLRELSDSLTWVHSRFPTGARNWLAYPYGAHDPRVLETAAAAGYEAGFTISSAWNSGGIPLAVPRLNVSAGLSLNGFRARLAGFLLY